MQNERDVACRECHGVWCALQDAIPGSRTHGYVTGITDYGVFVGFYGGLKGLIHAKELDQKPQDCFETGQARLQCP